MARGLFVGLTTLDCIYRVGHVPTADEKVLAHDSLLVAGGPATNAAVMFRYLGNEAILLSAVGRHPTASLIHADLATQQVTLVDLTPSSDQPPPLSTILVTAATGERAVVSRNALDRQVAPPLDPAPWLEGVDVVLIDGHQMALGLAIVQLARQRQIPVIVDGGSWKPGFETVLPLATSVVVSSKFRLPNQVTAEATLSALHHMGLVEVATTFGPQPIHWWQGPQRGTVLVPQVPIQDTLGAGDMFHGAFCHYRLVLDFPAALAAAARQAAQTCQYFGTRAGLAERSIG